MKNSKKFQTRRERLISIHMKELINGPPFSLRSKRFRASSSRKLEREQKKEWRGRGRGKKEPIARKPYDFEKLRSPTNAASDWCGASIVDCSALETSKVHEIRVFKVYLEIEQWRLGKANAIY